MQQNKATLNALLSSLEAYKQMHFAELDELPIHHEVKVPKMPHSDNEQEDQHEESANLQEEEYGYPYDVDEYSEESEGLCTEELEAIDLVRLEDLEGKEQIEEPCSICLLPFEQFPEEIRVLPCEHLFHRSCVDHWLKEKPKCPKCKFDLREYL